MITRPCGECSGEGRVRTTRSINVKIPAGVSSGNRVHLDSQGDVGPGGGPAGDLYVELTVLPHEVFRREGDNLEMVVKVPMTAAALGTQIQIDTLESEVDGTLPADARISMNVPAGTQSGTRIALADRGVPRLRGQGRGELGVTLLVQTPTNLDDTQRDLLRSLAEHRGEQRTNGQVDRAHKGVFSRIKDAFTT